MTIDRTDVFSVLRSLSAGVPKTETALKKKIMKTNPEMDRDMIRKQSGKYVNTNQHGPLPLTFPVVKGAELASLLDEAQLQDKCAHPESGPRRTGANRMRMAQGRGFQGISVRLTKCVGCLQSVSIVLTQY